MPENQIVKPDFSSLPITERESEILLLAAKGMGDKEICQELGVAMGTVRTYWERMRTKLSAASRGEIIARALAAAYESSLRALAQEQAWARLLIDNLEDMAIFRTGADGEILTWNVGVERLLLYERQDFLGKNIDMIFTPEDIAAYMPEQERKVALEAGRSLDNRWHVRRDGVKIWVEGTLVFLGDGQGFAKLLQDRTAEMHAGQEVSRLTQELAGTKIHATSNRSLG